MVPQKFADQRVMAVEVVACAHSRTPAEISKLGDRVERYAESHREIRVQFTVLSKFVLGVERAHARHCDKDYLDKRLSAMSHCRLLEPPPGPCTRFSGTCDCAQPGHQSCTSN